MRRAMRALAMLAGLGVVMLSLGAVSASAYTPITRSKSNQTITLDGKHLTDPAGGRRGALRREGRADGRGRQQLARRLRAPARGRDARTCRSTSSTAAPGASRNDGDLRGRPAHARTTRRSCSRASWRASAAARRRASGPEVADEEIVRAMMVVRANTMVYEAASPQLTQALLDLLNKYVTPVVQSRGSPGEGDLPADGQRRAARWSARATPTTRASA